MKIRPLSQEGLKLIACITMLTDHVGMFFPMWPWMRLVGRIAFPIYCFLLSEGVQYTSDPRKYGLRLTAGMLLSEYPFDLLLWGGPALRGQSVMVTLLLGFFMLEVMKKIDFLPGKLLAAAPFALAAELLHGDYGAQGVMMILLFGLAKDCGLSLAMQTVGLGILSLVFPGWRIPLLGLQVPAELFCIFSMVPIALYSGKKTTAGPGVQWAFYLFYPVHLLMLGIYLRWILGY